MTYKKGVSLLVPYGTPHPDKCPYCKNQLVLRKTKLGPGYLCVHWPICRGAASANADGTAMGTAVTEEVRKLRSGLHMIIDAYWKNRPDFREKRKEIYAFMAKQMGVEEFHVGHLEGDELSKAFEIAQRELPRHF